MAHSARKMCKVGRRLCNRKGRHSIWKGARPEKKRETFSSQKQRAEKIHRDNHCWVVAEFAGEEFRQRGFPGDSAEKESTCQFRRCGFNPWIGKIPWRREWQPTPVFLPGKSHGQRSLMGYSPWGSKSVRHNLMTK